MTMGLAPYQIDAFAPDFAALERLRRGISVNAPSGELFCEFAGDRARIGGRAAGGLSGRLHNRLMWDRLTIREATGAADMARVRKLFVDYQHRLGVDLSFQGFADEINGLPGTYARPTGCLLLAVDGDNMAGGVGMRPLGGADV